MINTRYNVHEKELYNRLVRIESKLVRGFEELGINIEKKRIDVKGAYFCLCWNALVVAKALKKQLPHNLHARLLLGEHNEKTKKYIQLCSKLSD